LVVRRGGFAAPEKQLKGLREKPCRFRSIQINPEKSMTTATVESGVEAKVTRWKLREYTKVWSHGSRVYIKWSDKLGLSLNGRDPERAKLLVQQVLAKGSICPDLWEKTFYPTWSFGSVTYMD
jgi:hypothetical protein